MRKSLLFLITILILMSCRTQPEPIPEPVIEEIVFTEPEFEIISIIIIQADLINTEFETVIKINNPNEYDLRLTSIRYELHGNGMFWAQGISEDIAIIPAGSSAETKFRFSMNFINMNRRLLDDVIYMRRVQYVFKGEAELTADTPRGNSHKVPFDISGLSDVRQNR